ncbi:hypothetical protein [Ramlibacter sp.]|uniref:hypothetical protein n=1 Tax=Ramlibacter sp. TaxID=1917967 RepID=UPI003D0AA735
MSPWPLVAAVLVFAAGAWSGREWELGQQAQRDVEAQLARQTDARQQRQFNDLVAGRHAARLEVLNGKLGDAYAHIARLDRAACLDDRTVRVLNDTGVPDNRGAAAGEPARPAEAASAAGGGLRWASNISVGNYIAYCRTEYGKVSKQLDEILDIEDRRHPPPK